MAQVKVKPTGNCSDPAFQQELVDYHEISVKEFVNMVVDYFEAYPFPVPFVITRPDIESAIDGINCEFEVMRLECDFTKMNNTDIVYSIGIPLDTNYSIGLIRGLLTRFPAATEFHFYKAFIPTCQQFSIIFQVWDGTLSLYNGDFSNTLP